VVIKAFPAVEQADPNGLLAIGGDLEVASLILAYKQGIFPWPFDEETLAWFSPPKRAILDFNDFHISRSLARELKKTCFTFSINKCFPDVIRSCSSLTNRKPEQGTWITEEIIQAYINLFEAGHCFSIEVWLGHKLVGGVYGVQIGGFISGESMFYRVANASKLALCFLVEHFRALDYTWLDCQVLTPHMQALGAKLISRKEFIKRLRVDLKS
jgi:leucyl/phenylalanyl-tRNA--protein transferase